MDLMNNAGFHHYLANMSMINKVLVYTRLQQVCKAFRGTYNGMDILTIMTLFPESERVFKQTINDYEAHFPHGLFRIMHIQPQQQHIIRNWLNDTQSGYIMKRFMWLIPVFCDNSYQALHALLSETFSEQVLSNVVCEDDFFKHLHFILSRLVGSKRRKCFQHWENPFGHDIAWKLRKMNMNGVMQPIVYEKAAKNMKLHEEFRGNLDTILSKYIAHDTLPNVIHEIEQCSTQPCYNCWHCRHDCWYWYKEFLNNVNKVRIPNAMKSIQMDWHKVLSDMNKKRKRQKCSVKE